MGIYYLLKEVNPLYDPLGAENKMNPGLRPPYRNPGAYRGQIYG